jgi:hypothetical protein
MLGYDECWQLQLSEPSQQSLSMIEPAPLSSWWATMIRIQPGHRLRHHHSRYQLRRRHLHWAPSTPSIPERRTSSDSLSSAGDDVDQITNVLLETERDDDDDDGGSEGTE